MSQASRSGAKRDACAETRTSAPVTCPRGDDLQSPVLQGLYPCGEGCGHAGGIASAAIDGLRVGRRLLAEAQPP